MILGILLFIASVVQSLDNGQGLTPAMGFNTWYYFYCNFDENLIKAIVNSIIELGLRDVGYNYIIIDDCWMTTYRNEKHELVADPRRFPSGIKALADYCHDKGFKLGIYSSSGTKTCQGLPASLNYEEIDAATWASWDIDYVKFDNCFNDNRPAIERYSKMRDALNKTGRPIYYSICNWGQEKVWEWGASVSNSWRTEGDIEDTFDKIRKLYMSSVKLWMYAGKGGWNDFDVLEVGNGGMSTIEYKTHFTLWAMAKSPLLLSCNLTAIKKEDLEIVKNIDIIALNQDKLGKASKCVLHCDIKDFSKDAEHAQFTTVELEGQNFGLAITNWGDNPLTGNIKVNFKELQLPDNKYKVKNLWTKEELGIITGEFKIPELKSHETYIFRLNKV